MYCDKTSVAVGTLLGLLGLLAGCTPQPARPKPVVRTVPHTTELPKPPPGPDPYRMTVEEVERAPLESDIVRVHTHYNLFPWLQFDLTDPRPQGFMVSALFLISGKTGKGVFADGLIAVKMYRIDRDQQRRETRTLVQTWQFTPMQALPYRAVRRTEVGEGYQLHLRWADDLELTNREIMVVVQFTRRDGKVISSGPKSFKIPEKFTG